MKKLLITLAIIAAGLVGTTAAHASQSDNVFGYAWSHNTGWISMNSCSESGGVVSCGSGAQYGVTIDPTTGDVSGYGWSSNIGWIDFGDAGSCGASAQVTWNTNGTGTWTGFVRALSASTSGNAGGWDGCISMKSFGTSGGPGGGLGTASASYGVVINTNGNFSGYAWNANNAGGRKVGDSWINFSPAYFKIPAATLELSLDSTWSNACTSSNPITLSWVSTGIVPNSCDFSGGAVSAQNQVANSAGMSFFVPQAPNINITITCEKIAGGTIVDTVGPLSCSQCSDGIDNADADSDVDENDSACMSCPPNPPDPTFISTYLPSFNSESGSCVNQVQGPRTTPIYEER